MDWSITADRECYVACTVSLVIEDRGVRSCVCCPRHYGYLLPYFRVDRLAFLAAAKSPGCLDLGKVRQPSLHSHIIHNPRVLL